MALRANLDATTLPHPTVQTRSSRPQKILKFFPLTTRWGQAVFTGSNPLNAAKVFYEINRDDPIGLLDKMPMNKSGLLAVLSFLLLTGCSKEQSLTDKDRAYYHEALAAGLRPSVVIVTENTVAEQLFGNPQANAAMAGRIQTAYAASINASANQLASLDSSGVNPEIVAMAGDMKIARLKQLEVIPNIREPDMGGATAEFLAKLIFNQLSARDNKDSDARMRTLFESSLQGAGQYVTNYTQSVEANGRLEQAIYQRPTACMEKLGGKNSADLPTQSKIIGEILQEHETRCTRVRNSLDSQALYRSLIGRSPSNGYTFEDGEMVSLKVLSQETKGHCFISDIEINLIGTRTKKPYLFRIKTAHSVRTDGTFDLIFIK